ncbi:MAG: rhomboid family intramembrane serine protease [Cytophagales bacterium]|nr:MAG: rhomboid family intramembrane serine protease [Cytophagales bacterium]
MELTLFFILLTVAFSFYAWNSPEIQAKCMMNPGSISKRREYYRFLTSGFIHADIMHLGVNMFTFYFFGRSVELIYKALFGNFFGGFLFVLLYLLGIILSDLPTFYKHRNSYAYNALGASGGVSAIVFASILFNPLNDVCLYGILCLPGFILGVLYLVYSASMKDASDGVNHEAHFWGALFGIVFDILVYPNVIFIFIEGISSWRGFF